MATLAYRDILYKKTQTRTNFPKIVSYIPTDHTCDKIKEYLLEPPILMPPVEGRPLITYLTVLDNSMGCVLGQHDEFGRKEHAIYYLSKNFTYCETRYSLLEKTCCALVWAACRLRQIGRASCRERV